MTRGIDVIKNAIEAEIDWTSEEALEDLVQDIMSAEIPAMGGAKVSLDSARALAPDAMATVGARDGVLILIFRGDAVEAHVARLGLMTEGRLEQSMMSLYNVINRARVMEHQRTGGRVEMMETTNV